jgi:membrane protein implicated in regulation of membrane protease activity
MIQLYLGTLAFGGTLLVLSLVLGAGQKDLDKDVDKEVDLDKDVDAGGVDWLPVTSLRFWTFFFAFGGAVGTLLTYFGSLSTMPVAAVSFGVGYASGIAVATTMRTLRRNSVGSEVSPRDLHGETAEVVVPLVRDQIGKVRVVAKGRIFDLIAETDDEERLPSGTKVMILGEGAEGRIQVTRS